MKNVINKSLGFTKVPNTLLWNKKLRLEEKALLAILISNDPSKWNIFVTEIYSRSENSDGSQRATLKSLIKKGYATQSKFTDPNTKQIKWQTKPYLDGNAHENKYPSLEFSGVGIIKMEIPSMEAEPLESPLMESTEINNINENNIKEENTKEENINPEANEKNKKETNIPGESPGSKEGNHPTDSGDGNEPYSDDEEVLPF